MSVDIVEILRNVARNSKFWCINYDISNDEEDEEDIFDSWVNAINFFVKKDTFLKYIQDINTLTLMINKIKILQFEHEETNEEYVEFIVYFDSREERDSIFEKLSSIKET